MGLFSMRKSTLYAMLCGATFAAYVGNAAATETENVDFRILPAREGGHRRQIR